MNHIIYWCDNEGNGHVSIHWCAPYWIPDFNASNSSYAFWLGVEAEGL